MNISINDNIITAIPALTIQIQNTMTLVNTFSTDNNLLKMAENKIYLNEINILKEKINIEILNAKKILPIKKNFYYRVCQFIKTIKLLWHKI